MDRKFSCTTWSVDENLCLTKTSVLLLPPSVKSMSFQKLCYTTSSIDENQRAGQKLGCTTSSVVVSRGPTKNSLVLLPPSEKIDVRRKTWLYYLHRQAKFYVRTKTRLYHFPPPLSVWEKLSPDQNHGHTTISISQNCSSDRKLGFTTRPFFLPMSFYGAVQSVGTIARSLFF